jgi:transposase
MARFIEAEDRTQSALFPEQLDDWIAEDNPVRVIDVFVDELDLEALGFDRAQAAATGRPGYHPATLLKIYIYGYLNRVQSSRRLEREAQRNLELIWLTGRLAPDFKTIADFRRDNGAGIRQVCRQFIELSRSLDLFSEAIVAIDGSKFKAVNNRNKNFTAGKLQATLRLMEENIGRYLDELDRADRQPESMPEGRVAHLKQKIATAKARMRKLGQVGRQLQQSPDRQVSLTDPDARSMANSGQGTAVVGYNVQIAVDTKHHLIVAEEVTNAGHDRAHLAEMARQAKGAVGEDELTVLADRGYFDSEEILQCAHEGIAALVPKPLTSNSKAEGRFDKRDFVYDAKRDEYRCPAGERAIWRMTTIEAGLRMHSYWPSACPRCPLKNQCTTSNQRRIRRWEHEHVLEAMQTRLDRTPSAARMRRRTVEHVFGTLKAWMGATHFLTKTLPRVRTEISLHVLAYNLRRLMSLLGVEGAIAVMKA